MGLTGNMAANAVCEASHRPISVSDGADAVQGASQPHPIICMERIPCIQQENTFQSGFGHHAESLEVMPSCFQAKYVTQHLCCAAEPKM